VLHWSRHRRSIGCSALLSPRISIGLVIDALISFVAVAFFLFLIVKMYNNWKKEDPAAGPTDIALLVEIRDISASQRQRPM